MISAAPRRGRAHRRPDAVALSWRVILDGACSGPRNMALDHALASASSDGQGVLRLYGWARPTVSFGRNEPVLGLYSAHKAEALGVDYVRRLTGGRAVLHDREVTYAVVVPIRALGGVRVAYRRINDALASALRSLGATVGVSAAGGVMALDAGPCFQSPAGGEVVAEGRKLVGSAQARVDGALLQHGSIMLAGDQSLLGALQDGGGAHEAPATLEGLIGAVRTDEVAAAVMTHMEEAFGGSWDEGDYTAGEVEEADRLQAERYAQDTWTWRR